MKSFALGNGILNRLEIFGRSFISASTKGLVCPKLNTFTIRK